MDKNYRIHTNIASDTILNVNMQQDYDFLEVLTMKLRQKDAYRLHSSNYGVIIGRVLANDAFGIPNAKISVFIERDTNDPVDIENIYPYSEVTSKDKEGRRYNLLPDYSDDDCYRIVGTFPNKRLLLDNDIQIEIYEKYWKYTTVTNNAGDYMIFGVPSGSQQIHVDIDLSDIGILSQKPRDFEYKGYNITMFDNPNQFKESTNLDSLAQLFSQDKSVFVYPFWGDADNGIASITRCDVQIQYKFEPTCVFMGSIVSDNEGNTIGHKCAPDDDNGMNSQLIAGEGTIEMIRKTQDGLVEEYQIQGNQLIDSDGVWCYQIPMNLDFIGTDEYGNIVPTDNPNKGIPTRTQVRFRISKHDTGDEGFSVHTAKYLVPMNPIFSEESSIDSSEGEEGVLDGVQPVIESSGQDIEKMYIFGSNTPQSCFRDLYWNNVYSVKNYIPKVQVAHRPYASHYGALKGANLAEDKNPIPFNKLRVELPFLYVIVCIIFDIVIFIVSMINNLICLIDKLIIANINSIIDKIDDIISAISKFFGGSEIDLTIPYIACVEVGGGLSDDKYFLPGCQCGEGQDAFTPENENATKGSDEELDNLVVERLAEEFKIIKLDFYQDWINGCLYMPLWYWRKRKKKSYLFGLITRRAKNQFCNCNDTYSRLKTYVTCDVKYKGNSLEVTDDNQVPEANDWHKRKTDWVRYVYGLIKGIVNKDGLTSYYYVATQATTENQNSETTMAKRTEPFYAVRLYATDIILLGNLNEDNLYGIPQFFKVLPSTTANIPAIATIEEENNVNEDITPNEEDVKDNDLDDNSEDSGITVTTGMHWGQKGDERNPKYGKGLFVGLYCTRAITRAKSCFNVERLSELGANLDMTYKMSFTKQGSTEVEYGDIFPDGFISKLELDDMENRAMFATMNHIGFVPQPYQDSISGYTTQVEDKNTNYLVPKFRYIYPVDFDGRQQLLMNRYYNPGADDIPFSQHMFDEIDESYITFRLGADKNPEKGEKNRLRHFYHHYTDDGLYSMPVYNNSFYFYFGVNKGSTAIDKFNKMFYSECFRNSKIPFSSNIETRGKSFCLSIYDANHVKNSYPYIRYTSDDIQTPFSYTLYDSLGDVVIYEDEMSITDFVIGGQIINNKVVPNNFGAITYQKYLDDDDKPISAVCSGNSGYVDCAYNPLVDNHYATLANETYVLDITDSNGKTISEEITLMPPNVSFVYEVRPLGTKFYNTSITKIDFICDEYNKFYGIIRVPRFYVDGYEFSITSATLVQYSIGVGKYQVNVSGTPATQGGKSTFGENASVEVVFELISLYEEPNTSVRQCMCEKNNGMENSNLLDASTLFKFVDGGFEFAVYRPEMYNMKMWLVCDGKVLDGNNGTVNSEVSQNITVMNGEDFDTRLNEMPVRFMLGTVNDTKQATISDTSNFYGKNATGLPKGSDIKGWYGVHKEDTYKFSSFPTTETYELIWEKYDFNGVTQVDTKKKIIKYKFDRIFKLSNVAYLTNTSDNTFRYTANGGVPPTMIRTLHPIYDEIDTINRKEAISRWINADSSRAKNENRIPNIIGNNYYLNRSKDRFENTGETVSTSPSFNPIFYEANSDNPITNYVGNYFMAATNNGRYTSFSGGNCNLSSMQIPSYAAVNLQGGWKWIGDDIDYNHSSLSPILKRACKSGNDGGCSGLISLPYLRAMFVDRKLDYNLIIWSQTPNDVKIYSDEKKNIPLNSARISGITYNGIEMSYEDRYNIISIGTENNPNAKNARLEYSYEIDANGDAHTVYNEPTTNIIWKSEDYYTVDNGTQHYYSYNDAFNAAREMYPDETDEELEAHVKRPNYYKSLLKTFYEAKINKYFDARELFWSTFNNDKLTTYWINKNGGSSTPPSNPYNSWIYDENSDFYLFKHDADTSLYNGYFNENNYPSMRLIDIGNVGRGRNDFNLSLASCSYSMNASIKNDSIIASTSKGDTVSVTLDLDKLIDLEIPPSDFNPTHMGIPLFTKVEPFANMVYTGTTSSYDGYKIFNSSFIRIRFKPNVYRRKGFTCYPRVYRIISVLDTVNFNENGRYKTDGLTYIKTTSKNDGLFNIDDTTGDLDTRIWNASVEWFDRDDNYPRNIYLENEAYFGNIGGWIHQSSFNLERDYYKAYDKILSINNTYFSQMIFDTQINVGNIRAFAILGSMDLYGNDAHRLNKVRTVETSEVFDTRNIAFKIVSCTVRDSDTTSITFAINTDNGQTDAINMLNQAFDEYSIYGFTFKKDENTTIDSTPQVSINNNIITLKVTLSDDIHLDTSSNWEVDFDIKSNIGFIYKIAFTMTYQNNNWNFA
jgi:hypothetical protein